MNKLDGVYDIVAFLIPKEKLEFKDVEFVDNFPVSNPALFELFISGDTQLIEVYSNDEVVYRNYPWCQDFEEGFDTRTPEQKIADILGISIEQWKEIDKQIYENMKARTEEAFSPFCDVKDFTLGSKADMHKHWRRGY